MKTLVNKRNPAIKIIADTLLSDSFNYITSFCSVPKSEWTLVEEEQPEVDLERNAVQFCFDKGLNITPYQAKTIARHFYELGLKVRK